MTLTERQIARIPVDSQVTVFGFACDQSPTLMPLPIWLAHKMARRLAAAREEGLLPYLMPDGKVQVGVEYRARKPFRVHSATITASQTKRPKAALEAPEIRCNGSCFHPDL
jgi:S-adenosylmethionine synthetase